MESFILKIYRRDKTSNKLVGTLQNINSEQQFTFTTKKELCTLLTELVDAEADDDPEEADSASHGHPLHSG